MNDFDLTKEEILMLQNVQLRAQNLELEKALIQKEIEKRTGVDLNLYAIDPILGKCTMKEEQDG